MEAQLEMFNVDIFHNFDTDMQKILCFLSNFAWNEFNCRINSCLICNRMKPSTKHPNWMGVYTTYSSKNLMKDYLCDENINASEVYIFSRIFWFLWKHYNLQRCISKTFKPTADSREYFFKQVNKLLRICHLLHVQ